MTDDTSRVKVAASTTGLAGVRTVDKEVGSVDARLRRRRKLAPARSNSAALSIALSVFFTAPCLSTRTCLLAVKFPPPRGPCFAIEAGLFFSQDEAQQNGTCDALHRFHQQPLALHVFTPHRLCEGPARTRATPSRRGRVSSVLEARVVASGLYARCRPMGHADHEQRD